MKKYCFLFLALSVAFLSNAQTEQLTNELIWYSGEFRMEYVGGLRSMQDGEHYTTMESSEENGSEIVKYAYASGDKIGIIASSKSVFNDPSKSIDDYEFSGDERKLLIKTETESIYRHSSKANYYVHLIEKQRSFPLADFAKGKQRLADFSPAGDKVAFVRGNNLFVTDVVQRDEVQITTDGKDNHIINGATDWVYEEEFGFDKGFYWSPKGDRIAYYRFDESKVKQFQMAMYGDLYPDQYTFKYPKAGEENSLVNIFIYDINVEDARPVDIKANKEQYIPRIQWSQDNNKLCIMRMNRHQNHLEFLMTDLTKREQPFELATTKIFEEKNDTYIEINDNLIFMADGKSFLWNSERDGYNHIYRFDMSGNVEKQLTKGEWDVIEFIGYDENEGNVIYTSSKASPLEKHIYATSVKRGKTKKLSTRKGTNDGDFSATYEYYINYHSDANTP